MDEAAEAAGVNAMNGSITGMGSTEYKQTEKFAYHANSAKRTDRPYMSVLEMGNLLGLKKTDRYWLVQKNLFETKVVGGKMWVDRASFEDWYANQVKYHKVTGEEPGLKLKVWSYSPREISEMLGICEQGAYELIKRNHIETVTVDGWIRVPKKAFQKWYRKQDRYRTQEDREKDAFMEAASVTMPEMARMLGTTRQKVYYILKDPKYQHFFEFIVIGGRKRITRDSLMRFLEGQDVFKLTSKGIPDDSVNSPDGTCSDCRGKKKTSIKDSGTDVSADPAAGYMTIQEAAQTAKISRQAISRHIEKGTFGKVEYQGGKIRISREEFGKWMLRRMFKEGAAGNGID